MTRPSRKKPDSYDAILLNVFSIGLFFQVALPISVKRVSIPLWAGILICFAIQHRRKHEWQWPGVTWHDLLSCLWALLIIWLFLFPGVYEVLITTHQDNHLWDVIQRVIGAFPDLITGRKSIQVLRSILIQLRNDDNSSIWMIFIPYSWFVFQLLEGINVVTFYKKDFFSHCRLPKTTSSSTHSFIARPVTIEKMTDRIRVKFYTLSKQALVFPCILFIIMFVGFIGVIDQLIFVLTKPDIEPVLIFVPLFLTVVMPYMLWISFVWILLIRTIDFTKQELIVGNLLLGRYTEKFRIERQSLPPLYEKQVWTDISEVKDAVLMIKQRGRRVELARHLIPEAMDAIQSIYDRYRMVLFDEFYQEIQPMSLKERHPEN